MKETWEVAFKNILNTVVTVAIIMWEHPSFDIGSMYFVIGALSDRVQKMRHSLE